MIGTETIKHDREADKNTAGCPAGGAGCGAHVSGPGENGEGSERRRNLS